MGRANGLVNKETWKIKNVFETYLLMGPARNLKELSSYTGVGIATLRNWSRSFKWNEKVAVRDQKAISAIEAENDIILKDTIMRRHQEAYQAVQEKALDYLTKKSTSFAKSKSPARDASIALDIGVKGERQVLGLSDSKIKAGLVKEGLAAMVEIVMKS